MMRKIICLLFVFCVFMSCNHNTDRKDKNGMTPSSQKEKALGYTDDSSFLKEKEGKDVQEGYSSYMVSVSGLLSVLSLILAIVALLKVNKKTNDSSRIEHQPRKRDYVSDYEYNRDITVLRNKLKMLEEKVSSLAESHSSTPLSSIPQPKEGNTYKKEKKVFYFPSGSNGYFRDMISTATGAAIFRVTQEGDSVITFEPINFERLRTMGKNKDSVVELVQGSCSWIDAKDMKIISPGTLAYIPQPGQGPYWKVKDKIKLVLTK